MKIFNLILAFAALPLVALAQTPRHIPPTALTCPGDRTVWVNTRSGVYHYQGERYYGSTKEGQFECERQAKAEGNRATRNGQ
jgi:hypothetical protein